MKPKVKFKKKIIKSLVFLVSGAVLVYGLALLAIMII